MVSPSTDSIRSPARSPPARRRDVADANRAADAAAAAFPAWSATGPNARARVLLKAADALEAKAAEFVDA